MRKKIFTSEELKARIKARKNADRQTPRYKATAKIYMKAYDVRPEVKARKNAFRIKKLYGITLEQYQEMLTLQISGCTICHKTNIENGKALAVDHDHKTGQVRSLLCQKCNYELGLYEYKRGLFKLFEGYLQAHQTVNNNQ